jgi:hypothetical protein
MLDAGVRDVRNQGVLLRGVNADAHAAARPVLRAAGRRRRSLPYYFYMCDMIPAPSTGGCRWRGADAAARHHGLPARLRDAADRLRRAVRRQALGAPGRRVRPRARHQLLDEELPHLDRAATPTTRPRGAGGRAARYAVLRPDPAVHPARELLRPSGCAGGPNGVGEVEVGWHLHPDSWGHGYATEAARAVIDRGFGRAAGGLRRRPPGQRGVDGGLPPAGHAAAGPDAPLVRRRAGGVPADGARSSWSDASAASRARALRRASG